jgi:hypothetical protein
MLGNGGAMVGRTEEEVRRDCPARLSPCTSLRILARPIAIVCVGTDLPLYPGAIGHG